MKTLKLLPRARVNYGLIDLCKSLFVGENSTKYCDALRREISNYMGVNDVLLTSSGRAGLYMILRYLKQNTVYIPSYTCKVVTEAVKMAGKEIVYVDCETRTFNSTEIPKGDGIFIATHQYGYPCNIDEIVEVCHKNGCVVIEDCAAAFGTEVNGCKAGLKGDYAFYSFDSSKLITVPSKGGFVIAKNVQELQEITKATPLEGHSAKYKISNWGEGLIYLILQNNYVYRLFHYLMLERKNRWQLSNSAELDLEVAGFYTHTLYEWQASIALPQIKNIQKYIDKRAEVFRYFESHLDKEKIQVPPYVEKASMIRFPILVKDKDEFYKACTRRGVDCAFSFSHCVCPAEFKNAHYIAETILDLPFYYKMTIREMEKVVRVVNEVAKQIK